jgi:hypothetical protein
MESLKKEILQSNSDSIEEYRKSIIGFNKSIASAEEDLKNLKKKSDERFPRYEKIVETFQWIVNKENQPTPAYGELVAISSDSSNNKVLIKHNDPGKSLLIISKIDTDNFEEYAQKFSAINFLNFLYN